MVDPTGKLTDYKLPEDGTEGHLTLLLAEHLAARLRAAPGSDPRLSMEALVAFTRRQIQDHHRHWRKNAREPGQDRVLCGLVLARLEALSLVRREADSILPLPALGRYALAREDPAAAAEPEFEMDLS
jgi:uncharacterized protein (TIGR02678 family)